MSSDYSYDDEGTFYPFFIFTLTSIVTLPLAWSLLKPSSDADARAPRIKTTYKPEHSDLVEKQRAAQKRRQRKVKRFIAVVVGFALMGLMLYLIFSTQRTVAKIWNPYDILGIDESASEGQIKTHWRRLQRTTHPDKVRPDPAKNETAELISDRYVELTKAYAALTDEEVRNNYIQYGHPDGKQSFSIGIALPRFIVSDGNGKYVVLLYAALLGVLLPYLVGSWWYGTQRLSKEGVLIESANEMFREYEEEIDEGSIVAALSVAKEFQAHLKGDKAESGLAKIESRIMAGGDITPFAAGLGPKDAAALASIESSVRRKVLALLWAYLGRVDLDDQTLDNAKYMVAPIAFALSQSFNAITLAYGNTLPILNSYQIGQRLIQAIPPNHSPLLQLPHFTNDIARAVEGQSRIPLTIQQFLDQPDAVRRKRAIGKGLLTESQYKEVIEVASQLPFLRLETAFFKVTGEKVIIPSSLVSLVVKGRVIPPGVTEIPPVKGEDLLDIDPAEDDLQAMKKDDTPPELPPVAFAPRYARSHSPKWVVFLTDSKQGKMAVPPFTIFAFESPIFTPDGKPTFNMQTFKFQFAAPPGPGEYTFVLHLLSDCYMGFDYKAEVKLVVEDASKAMDMDAEDEISEPDEDSLAGQLASMKGGDVAPRSKKRKEDEDSDEESGTDEEVDDTSDTNTDTEDES